MAKRTRSPSLETSTTLPPNHVPLPEMPDPIPSEPGDMEEVRRMRSTVGAAAGGHIPEEDIEEARLRLHDAQVALSALGYDRVTGEHERPLATDGTNGVWDNDTANALSAFQRDHDLEITGQLDAETYQALMGEYETGLETESRRDEQDPFSPIHAERPVND